ncbi:hypothetical protein [Arenimonas sp.]|uniref:hypothetical protein n=1 Tax=Arenimonas sp. TaxID=1872635 RepID=UPI0035B21FB9
MRSETNVPAGISPDALFAKSQHFVASALTARNSTDMSLFPLSAAIALELLAKAALASRHPSLIVDVKKNENTLLAAAGLAVETRVATIGAEAAYARMKHLAPRFRDSVYKACKKLSEARNAYLHSGDLPFTSGDHGRWEPDFWYAAELMLATMNRSFEDWLGSDGAIVSKTVLQNARDARKASVSVRIVEHKEQFLELFPKISQQNAARSKSEARDPVQAGRSELYDGFECYWLTECPACECFGVSGGNHSETLLAEDQSEMELGWESIEKIYDIAEFACSTCGLHLNDEEAYFAGLDEPYIVESEREIEWEPDYGND